MSDKPIPNADTSFLTAAETFARIIASDPAKFEVSQADAAALSQAVERYAAALQRTRCGSSRCQQTTREKNEARREAERIMRRLRNLIRVNDRIDAAARFQLNLPAHPGAGAKTKRSRARACPMEPPRLWFVRALHEGRGATPMHELKFTSLHHFRKAEGAVRLELFVGLVPPEELIPQHPGVATNLGGQAWYLRSYTRSPIVLAPPMARVPMRVVYWGRWADSCGNVGPFSKTVQAWIEGGSHHLMGPRLGKRIDANPMTALPPEADAAQPASARMLECSMLVLEAQCQSYLSAAIVPLLEAQGSAAGELEAKQNEGDPMPDRAMPRLLEAR